MAMLLSCYGSFWGLARDTIVLENLDCLSYTIYSWTVNVLRVNKNVSIILSESYCTWNDDKFRR